MTRRFGANGAAVVRQADGPPAGPLEVSIGSNREIRQVVMFFDDPKMPNAKYVTFTAEQARGIGHAMIAEADKADGTRPS